MSVISESSFSRRTFFASLVAGGASAFVVYLTGKRFSPSAQHVVHLTGPFEARKPIQFVDPHESDWVVPVECRLKMLYEDKVTVGVLFMFKEKVKFENCMKVGAMLFDCAGNLVGTAELACKDCRIPSSKSKLDMLGPDRVQINSATLDVVVANQITTLADVCSLQLTFAQVTNS